MTSVFVLELISDEDQQKPSIGDAMVVKLYPFDHFILLVVFLADHFYLVLFFQHYLVVLFGYLH